MDLLLKAEVISPRVYWSCLWLFRVMVRNWLCFWL